MMNTRVKDLYFEDKREWCDLFDDAEIGNVTGLFKGACIIYIV
jgi:hypothetical protein